MRLPPVYSLPNFGKNVISDMARCNSHRLVYCLSRRLCTGGHSICNDDMAAGEICMTETTLKEGQCMTENQDKHFPNTHC